MSFHSTEYAVNIYEPCPLQAVRLDAHGFICKLSFILLKERICLDMCNVGQKNGEKNRDFKSEREKEQEIVIVPCVAWGPGRLTVTLSV